MPGGSCRQMKTIFGAAFLFSSLLVAAAQQEPVKRPPITAIAHVGLVAQNLNADRNFYEHMLGWTAVPSIEVSGGLRFYGVPKQWVEVAPAKSPSDPAFNHVAFATADVRRMRAYLAQRGVAVPATVLRWPDGSRSFQVKDPEGNLVEFIQLPPMPAHLPPDPQAISSRIIHAGFLVRDAATEDRFYRQILGFRLYWTGGMKDGVTDFFSLQVPEGTDWIEYMLHVPPHPSHRELGVADHFSLGVRDINTVVSKLSARGWTPSPGSHKQMGRDGKYQLNVYDPDEVRIEYMEFKPAQKPCCAPFTGPHPEPD
jgi:catechol 2,3-dioxygenase-like lactoylglutathione lyase family enzyme